VKIVLDNCVHYKAKSRFPGHTVSHARDEGWQRLINGELLAVSAKRFEVLVTTDKKIRNQQNLEALPLTVIELASRFVRWEDLVALSPYFPTALSSAAKYRFISIHSDGTIELLAERIATPPTP
jgi:hypothetical protein